MSILLADGRDVLVDPSVTASRSGLLRPPAMLFLLDHPCPDHL